MLLSRDLSIQCHDGQHPLPLSIFPLSKDAQIHEKPHGSWGSINTFCSFSPNNAFNCWMLSYIESTLSSIYTASHSKIYQIEKKDFLILRIPLVH